ncbi:hypothetical protein C8R45DRAFT_1006971 [Mycena sanguinolenta]|nr:hypothetical protein C8R45DRAFT_1006971 [Mycena sanguinolenta]
MSSVILSYCAYVLLRTAGSCIDTTLRGRLCVRAREYRSGRDYEIKRENNYVVAQARNISAAVGRTRQGARVAQLQIRGSGGTCRGVGTTKAASRRSPRRGLNATRGTSPQRSQRAIGGSSGCVSFPMRVRSYNRG